MKVIYWSQTGNTQKMAELIAKGIEEGGKKAEIVGESLSVMESPEGEDEAKCVEFGKLIAQQ